MVRLACALLLVSTAASASPLVVGASLGVTQDQTSATAGQGPSSTLALFGRLGLSNRFSIELDLAKANTSDSIDTRTATVFAVFDLSTGSLVPQIFAGAGLDRASDQYGDDTDGHHFEGGFGLEYRGIGGLVIGSRFHLGGRSIDSQPAYAEAAPGGAIACCGGYGSTMNASEYRSLDAYAGVRF